MVRMIPLAMRPGRIAAALGMLAALCCSVALAQDKAKTRERLAIDPAVMMKPWMGDLDAMIERRLIRVLVVPSRTHYFFDRATQRGATYDALRLFEEELNRKLAADKKLKSKRLKVAVAFIPIGREQQLAALAAGKGDIAAANLAVTAERRKLVDFSAPSLANVTEVLVTGPASPSVASVDDLAGKEVFVRKSSSYYESVVALNKRFATERKPAVTLKEAPDHGLCPLACVAFMCGRISIPLRRQDLLPVVLQADDGPIYLFFSFMMHSGARWCILNPCRSPKRPSVRA